LIEGLLAIILGFLLCLVLGANNSSTFFGTAVGSGFVKYSTATIFASIGVVLGVLLEGAKLSNTIANGVLPTLNTRFVFVLVITSLIIIAFANYFRLPLSASQCLVGASIGIGLANNIDVDWYLASVIFISWISTPLISIVVSVVIYRIVSEIGRSTKRLLRLNYFYEKVTLIAAFYFAYAFGANTIGLITGLYSNLTDNNLIMILVFGSATVLGLMFRRRVSETVGKGIVGLSPSTALSAQMSGAITIHALTQLRFPVSACQALMGGIFGIGYAKSVTLMNKRLIGQVVLGWVLAPGLGLAISFTCTFL